MITIEVFDTTSHPFPFHWASSCYITKSFVKRHGNASEGLQHYTNENHASVGPLKLKLLFASGETCVRVWQEKSTIQRSKIRNWPPYIYIHTYTLGLYFPIVIHKNPYDKDFQTNCLCHFFIKINRVNYQ